MALDHYYLKRLTQGYFLFRHKCGLDVLLVLLRLQLLELVPIDLVLVVDLSYVVTLHPIIHLDYHMLLFESVHQSLLDAEQWRLSLQLNYLDYRVLLFAFDHEYS